MAIVSDEQSGIAASMLVLLVPPYVMWLALRACRLEKRFSGRVAAILISSWIVSFFGYAWTGIFIPSLDFLGLLALIGLFFVVNGIVAACFYRLRWAVLGYAAISATGLAVPFAAIAYANSLTRPWL